jgi:hypothetical protein
MEIVISFAVLVALTTGVVEVIKRIIGIDSKFLPLTALVVGVVLTFLGGITNTTSLTVLTGIAVGLSAAGLFDHTKLLKS